MTKVYVGETEKTEIKNMVGSPWWWGHLFSPDEDNATTLDYETLWFQREVEEVIYIVAQNLPSIETGHHIKNWQSAAVLFSRVPWVHGQNNTSEQKPLSF